LPPEKSLPSANPFVVKGCSFSYHAPHQQH